MYLLQAVFDALHQIALLEHHRIGTAMLFSPVGAVIIVVFLALDPVRFPASCAPRSRPQIKMPENKYTVSFFW